MDNGKDSRGDNLIVWDNGHGHCMACGYHRFPKHFIPTTKETNNVPKSLRPSDFTREVPRDGWEWLLQFGLPYSYWKEYTGYSEEKGRRLVFPVGNPIQFSIGRALDTPNKLMRKWYVWGDCHRHCEVLGHGRGSAIVLVEDLISAHKVGQVSETIPLFGTKIHPAHIYYLRQLGKPVILWLDKDQELNTKKQAMQLQSLIDLPVKLIHTDKDPKSITIEELNANL